MRQGRGRRRRGRVAAAHVDGRRRRWRRRGRAQADVLQQHVVAGVVVVVQVMVVMMVHARPGRVVERHVGRMLPVVMLVVLSIARERQHWTARQILPAPLVHAVAGSRVAHPSLQPSGRRFRY